MRVEPLLCVKSKTFQVLPTSDHALEECSDTSIVIATFIGISFIAVAVAFFLTYMTNARFHNFLLRKFPFVPKRFWEIKVHDRVPFEQLPTDRR